MVCLINVLPVMLYINTQYTLMKYINKTQLWNTFQSSVHKYKKKEHRYIKTHVAKYTNPLTTFIMYNHKTKKLTTAIKREKNNILYTFINRSHWMWVKESQQTTNPWTRRAFVCNCDKNSVNINHTFLRIGNVCNRKFNLCNLAKIKISFTLTLRSQTHVLNAPLDKLTQMSIRNVFVVDVFLLKSPSSHIRW